jgi:hypothetical protein
MTITVTADGLTVVGISPTSGDAAGTPITISGSGFQSGATVSIGGVAVTANVVNGTTITTVSPDLAHGTLNNVVVTNPGNGSETLGKGWLANFLDVAQANGVHSFVEKIFRRGVTSGCGGGNYCPGNSVTRGQMAVFLLRAKEGGSYVPSTSYQGTFGDVPSASSFALFIEELARRGVTSGCGGGNYCPGNSVTRGQMAVFLLRAKEGGSYVPATPYQGLFGDVPSASSFALFIEELSRRNVTAGCGGGNYCPSTAVTRGQMAVFLTRTFGF